MLGPRLRLFVLYPPRFPLSNPQSVSHTCHVPAWPLQTHALSTILFQGHERSFCSKRMLKHAFQTLYPTRVHKASNRSNSLGSGYHRRSEEHTSELQSRFELACRL